MKIKQINVDRNNILEVVLNPNIYVIKMGKLNESEKVKYRRRKGIEKPYGSHLHFSKYKNMTIFELNELLDSDDVCFAEITFD